MLPPCGAPCWAPSFRQRKLSEGDGLAGCPRQSPRGALAHSPEVARPQPGGEVPGVAQEAPPRDGLGRLEGQAAPCAEDRAEGAGPQCSGIRPREARGQELRLRLAESLRGGKAQEGCRHARLGLTVFVSCGGRHRKIPLRRSESFPNFAEAHFVATNVGARREKPSGGGAGPRAEGAMGAGQSRRPERAPQPVRPRGPGTM